MKDFCENEHCDNPGVEAVEVSVEGPSDQKRTLCAVCHEAYTWGVQHGKIVTQAAAVLPHLDRFLEKDGFVILTHNASDPSKLGPFEAWAYQGPLDLHAAAPVTFGVGTSVQDALNALEHQLDSSRRQTSPSAQKENELRPDSGS